MYKTTVKLKSSCRQSHDKWLMTEKLFNPKGEAKRLVLDRLVSFHTHNMKDAITNIDLEEIEELHIIKILT